jgi:hypothetical protein
MGSTGRASRVGYWAAGLVVLMGLVAAVGWGWAGLSGMLGQVEAFARTDVPGEGVLTVQEPVDLTVFYEAPGIDQEQAELPPLTLYASIHVCHEHRKVGRCRGSSSPECA